MRRTEESNLPITPVRGGATAARAGRFGVGLFLTAAIAVMLAATAPATPRATPSATPVCSLSGLVVWLNTQGSGAAGSVYYRLELTNLSGHTCTLGGYGRAAAVDLAGRQIGHGSGRFVSRAPLVKLAPRASASAVLQILNVENFSRSACRPVTAAGIRFFPPHQNASKVVPFPFRACSRSGPEFMWLQAVRPGL